jgi:hypothetical protein
MSDELAPITHKYTLRCAPERAFVTYTSKIGEWWDPGYTANPETFEGVTIEPKAGGRVYAMHTEAEEDIWGEVTVWEPGRRLGHTFTLAQDADDPSEVTVVFTANEEGGCDVHFAHGGWRSSNAAAREKFGDWPILLDRFAALADSDL